MTELKRAIAKGAKEGRYGDSDLVHVNDREKLILALLGGSGTRNPKTGRLEFWDPSDPGDSGPPSDPNAGQGGGQIADLSPQDQQALGFNPNDLSDTRSVDISVGPNEAAAGSWAREVFGNKGFGKVAGWVGDKIGRMADRPVETAINGLASMTPLGPINMAFGLVDAPTIGSMSTAAGRGFAGMANPGQVAGQVEGKTTGAIGPSGDKPDGPMSPDGGDPNIYNPTQSGPSGSGMSPLAAALMGEPASQMGGRKTFGAPVMSSSPFGRQYTTPWAYRG